MSIGLNSSLFTVFAGLALRPMAGLGDPASVVSVSAESVLQARRRDWILILSSDFSPMAPWTFDGLVAHRAISVSLESERVGRTTPAYVVAWQLTSMFSESGWRTAAAFWPAKIGGIAGACRRARLSALAEPLRRGHRRQPDSHRRDPATVVGITPPEFSGPEGTPNRV